MKRLLSVFISICMIALLLPVGAAAVEVTPETPTRVACAYFVDDSGELKQVYYDSLGDAVAAAQGDNANGRVYIAKNCSYEGDLTISRSTVFACNDDTNVIVTMTGSLTLNAPLTIQNGAAFAIEAGADNEACIVMEAGSSITLNNVTLILNDGIGILNNTNAAAKIVLPGDDLQANNCTAALSGSFDLELGSRGTFRTNNCGTAHVNGSLNINMGTESRMYFNNSTGTGLTANRITMSGLAAIFAENCLGNGIEAENIVMSSRSQIIADYCRGNGVVADNITMDDSCFIEVKNSGKAPVSTFRLLRRAVTETGCGLVVNDKLNMTGAKIIAKDNKNSGIIVNDLTADSGSTLTVTGNGASEQAPAAMYVKGTALIEEGANVDVSANTSGGVGVADGAKLTMKSGTIANNGGSDIINEGSLSIAESVADKAEIKNNGSVSIIKDKAVTMAPMLLMRIGFAKITVLDADGAPAADAAYDLYSARGRKLRTCQTDENGVISTRSLTGGTYYLVPAGEALETESAWSFEVVGFGKCEAFTMTTESEQ